MRFRIFNAFFLSGIADKYSLSAQSPYSYMCLEEIVYPGNINSSGMGNISDNYSSSYSCDPVNLPLLALNEYATFDTGFSCKSRFNSNRIHKRINCSGNYKNPGANIEGLAENIIYANGIELILKDNSVSSDPAHVNYHAGLFYNQKQYAFVNNKARKFGINFGVSLPVSRPSLVNLAIMFGERKSSENIAINESFIIFSIDLAYIDI